MTQLVFICEPDENGVYSIGGRYINLIQYRDPFDRVDYTLRCPVCTAYQLRNYEGTCAVCGFNICRPDLCDFEKYKEENKERIKKLKETYGK